MTEISNFKNIHNASRCFILGSGPSIAKQNLEPLKNEITFCSNWFFNHEKFSELNINYYCAYDSGFVQPTVNKFWQAQINRGNLQVFFPTEWAKLNIVSNACFLPYEPEVKVHETDIFSFDAETALYDAGSVIVNFCLPLAFYMGFKEIILLGVETNYGIADSGDANAGYFYHPSKQLVNNHHNAHSEKIWACNLLASYKVVGREADKLGIKIRNATPGGNLNIFERVSLSEL